MPYFPWYLHSLGGVADGTITSISSNHPTHNGWCILITPTANTSLTVHITEPTANAVIQMVYSLRLEDVKVRFLYSSRAEGNQVLAVWLRDVEDIFGERMYVAGEEGVMG